MVVVVIEVGEYEMERRESPSHYETEKVLFADVIKNQEEDNTTIPKIFLILFRER